MSQPLWSPPPGPARGAGPVRLVVLGLAVCLAAGFFAFALTTYLNRHPVGSTPAASPAATPTGATTAAGPTPTPATTSPTTTPGPAGFDPPPLPYPQTWDEAEAWLEDNALYAHTLPPVDCALTRLAGREVPDLAVLDSHLAATMECLMQVWTPPVTAAGFVLPHSPVLSYDQPITTACGTSPSMDAAAAFYCPADQRIFYAVDRRRPLFDDTPLAVDNTLAHEVGHALQGRTGILLAGWAFQQQEEADAALEYNRRTELQADCLGGMALNALGTATAITPQEREQLRQDNYARGDHAGRPRTHGSPASGLRWISAGLEAVAVATCNTFVAPAEDVA